VVPISEIERIVMGVRDVRACHYVRSRGHEDAIYVDLHIKVAPEMTTDQSHAIAHDVQHRLRAEIPAVQDVVVHVEPEDTSGGEAATLIPSLRGLAEELGVAIHDITARDVDDAYHVEAHITVDGALSLGEAHHTADRLEALARDRIAHLGGIVTHIEPSDEAPEPAYAMHVTAQEVTEAVRALIVDPGDPDRCHDIQVHPVGDGWVVSIHCILDGDMSVREAHAISSQIEGRLRDAIPRLERVVVHTEPLPFSQH
jgi:divalent metal cation (Fe/Co/Zn/Cd) transporter